MVGYWPAAFTRSLHRIENREAHQAGGLRCFVDDCLLGLSPSCRRRLVLIEKDQRFEACGS